MSVTVGIRREDKSPWERRTPLSPGDLAALRDEHGLRFVVQSSPIRVFTDDDYRAAGIEVADTLDEADVVFAVKEIPQELLKAKVTYVYFSHVIKGQAYNMPMLERLLELGCSLVDYERITNESGTRLIGFSRYAGYAGALEVLWALGQRFEGEGMVTPLAELRRAFAYGGLRVAKEHVAAVGRRIAGGDLPPEVRPLVVGVAGYGNVSRGVQEILADLSVRAVAPEELAAARQQEIGVLQVVFREEHMVRARGNRPFDLQDYYTRPERYTGDFERHLPHLDALINTIYWEPRYPRLVTKKWAQGAFAGGSAPRLRVIGDISCDIGGSIEITNQITQAQDPCFTYDPQRDTTTVGIHDRGLVVMAVDNLPCELPAEASTHFSSTLKEMVAPLASANWRAGFDDLDLPPFLKNAVIVHQGQLTPAYRYLEKHLHD